MIVSIFFLIKPLLYIKIKKNLLVFKIKARRKKRKEKNYESEKKKNSYLKL